jgi:hypothetical protein
MGLVLIGGFMYVGASAYEKLKKSEGETVVQEIVLPAEKQKHSWHKPCNGGVLELPLGADVANVQLSKRHLVITTEAKGTAKQKIVVIDFCDNKVISEIEIK